MAGKDIEYELRTVDHPHLDRIFYIALLRRGKLVVEDDEARAGRLRRRRQLLQLAPPDERRRIGPVPHLQDFPHNLCARAQADLTHPPHGILLSEPTSFL